MSRSNSAGPGATILPMKIEMDHFDAMPKWAREVVRNLPLKLCATEIYHHPEFRQIVATAPRVGMDHARKALKRSLDEVCLRILNTRLS